MRRVLALLLASLTIVAAACGDDESTPGAGSETTAPEATATETTAAEPAGGCRKVDEPKPKDVGKQAKPKTRLDRKKTWTAVVKTSCGTIEIRLDVKENPKTASSFASLARSGFYDNLIFHRIPPNFVIQGGSPDGSPEGSPGYRVVEAPPRSTRYTPGVVAMAKTAQERPGTSGSQFFIVTGSEAASLEPDYAVVGKVSKGMDVTKTISQVQTDPTTDFRPRSPVVMQDVTIREGS